MYQLLLDMLRAYPVCIWITHLKFWWICQCAAEYYHRQSYLCLPHDAGSSHSTSPNPPPHWHQFLTVSSITRQLTPDAGHLLMVPWEHDGVVRSGVSSCGK
jgi:hypothetical protein